MKVEESITYVILSRSMYLSIFNRLGLNHDCDGRTDNDLYNSAL